MTSETKTIYRSVEQGKWRIGTEPGWTVTRVWLQGLRNRPWELRKVPNEEFQSYLRKIPNGRAIDIVVMRGLPNMWTTEGNSHIVQIFPAPAHEWKFQFEITKA